MESIAVNNSYTGTLCSKEGAETMTSGSKKILPFKRSTDTKVFHRDTLNELPLIERGEGVMLYDDKGKPYLDACGGAAVSCLGHSDPDVIAAMKSQVDSVSFAHTGFFTNQPMEELAEFIADRAPGDLNYSYFLSGGSEAIEAALKMARQYFLEIGQPERRYFIARKQSYHGNTLGALGVGGNLWRRAPFEPLLARGGLVEPCYEYRYRTENETVEEYARRTANDLDRVINELGPEKVAAFVVEPVVGATLGAVPSVKGYFKRIREICNKHNILLIFDEVMCGCARTGTFFASEQENVVPDMVTIAKGLGGGYQPIGAVIVSEKIYKTIREGRGYFQHGHTYMGHALACAAALAVQKKVSSPEILANINKMGALLKARLEKEFADHPYIGDIRGRGLFLGLEFVKNRETKDPFNNEFQLNRRIKRQALLNGLMCYPMGGTVDGQSGDHILLAPPFIVNESHVEEIVTKLRVAIDLAVKEISG